MKLDKTTKNIRNSKGTNSLNKVFWAIGGIVFMVLGLINLNYILIDKESNVFTLTSLKEENKKLRDRIVLKEEENLELRRIIDGLKNNPQTIEEEVRIQLNMVREGEVLYLDGSGDGGGDGNGDN